MRKLIGWSLLVLGLTGCVSDEGVQQRLVQRQGGQGQVKPAVQSAPVVPPKSPKPVSTTSPYFFISPWLGTWGLQEDGTFEIVMDPDGHVKYGPYFVGTYKFIQGDRDGQHIVMQYDLRGIAGQFKDRQLGAMLFQVEFMENGAVMVMTNGGARVVMLKKNEATK